jgi:hypothetical protein
LRKAVGLHSFERILVLFLGGVLLQGGNSSRRAGNHRAGGGWPERKGKTANGFPEKLAHKAPFRVEMG